MLKLHPLLSGLRCPWLRSLISISLAVAAMMLKTQKTADRTAASAASTTASPLLHRLHGPGTEITLLVRGAYPVWCSSVLKAPFLSSSPRYEISPSVAYMHTQEDAGKNAMTNSEAGQPSISEALYRPTPKAKLLYQLNLLTSCRRPVNWILMEIWHYEIQKLL